MALPPINVFFNSQEKIQLFWEYVTDPSIKSFNVYWSLDGLTFTKFDKTAKNDRGFYDKYVLYEFNRSTIGVSPSTEFFIRITSVNASSVESSPGESIKIQVSQDREEETNRSSIPFFMQMHGYDETYKVWRRIKVVKSDSDETGILCAKGVGDRNIEGGTACTIYTPPQNINGGTACT